MNLRGDITSLAAATAVALALALPAAADPPAPPWVTQVIGNPTIPGSIDVDASGVWTLTGASGASTVEERYRLVYQRLKGDASIGLRFLSMETASSPFPGGGASIGLAIRATDSPGSPSFDYWMGSGGFNAPSPFPIVRFQPGGVRHYLGYAGSTGFPRLNLLMRLQRVGQEITGFYSHDGSLWFQDSDPTLLPALSEEALFGLFLYAGGTRARTGKVDQVQVQPGATLVHGLRSCVRDQQVLLQWRPLKNALSYNVYRGPVTLQRGQVQQLNTDRVAGTSFTDNSPGLANDVPLTYAVAAVFPGADGKPVEGPLVAVPAAPTAVPPGWIGCSINERTPTGSVSYDAASGAITLRGRGNGFSNPGADDNAADEFYFLHQTAEEDTQITARLLNLPKGGGTTRQAGVMIRESLHAGARTVLLAVSPFNGWASQGYPGGLVRQIRRTTDRANVWNLVLRSASFRVPIVLRLTRRGDTITPEYSADDGQTFQAAGAPVTFSPPLGKPLFVGLASTGGANYQFDIGVSEATFDRVGIQKP